MPEVNDLFDHKEHPDAYCVPQAAGSSCKRDAYQTIRTLESHLVSG